jgi:hypothetical protein
MGILHLLSCKRVPPIHHPIHLTREYRASLDLDPRVPHTSRVSTSSHQRNGLTFTVSGRILSHTSSFPFTFRPVQSVCSLFPETHHPMLGDVFVLACKLPSIFTTSFTLGGSSHLYQPIVGITVRHGRRFGGLRKSPGCVRNVYLCASRFNRGQSFNILRKISFWEKEYLVSIDKMLRRAGSAEHPGVKGHQCLWPLTDMHKKRGFVI